MKRLLLSAVAAVVWIAQVCAQTSSAAAPKQLTIPVIFSEGGITGMAPETLRWSPDGSKISFLQRDVSGQRAELWYVDVATGKKALLVPAQKMNSLAPPLTTLPDRQREWRARYSVADYYWSPDSRSLLFDALGQLWLYNFGTGTGVEIVASAEPVQDPQFSPDGRQLSYVSKHNLYVRPASGGHATQLTRDTDANILNGEVDWVYAEELSVRHNYYWSPDSRRILFLQMDESRVPTYPIPDLIPVTASVDLQKYPKPGDPNPVVRLGVVAAAGGRVGWLKLPPGASHAASTVASQYYIPRFGWVRDGLVWAQVLNRAQDQLDLYFADVSTGRTRLVLSEKDPDWVEVNDNFTLLGRSDRFLWTSWRDGHTHIYLYQLNPSDPLGAEAKLERQLTRGDFEVFSIDAVDEDAGQVYFTCNCGDPLERQLYRVKLDGTGLERVSREEGTHAVTFGGKAKSYVDNFSASMTPPRLSFCSIDGSCQVFWQSQSIEPYQLIEPKFLHFKAEDGTLLEGMLLMPPHGAGKVPLLLAPYGGPAAQEVRNIWGIGSEPESPALFLFHQLLAREGIAVLTVDNRGMAGRGRAFTTVLKHNFGEVEIKDQLAALQQVLSLEPRLDGSRVGFWGWSYGGTMTLWALTRTEAFRAGVSVAPVTNWRDYDSIYTERYLGLPADNPQIYKRSSPVSSAGGLHGDLLLMHGTGDDNVHVQNTMQMAEAFIQAGKQFELMLYPRKTHSMYGSAARIDLFTRIQRHFERALLGQH